MDWLWDASCAKVLVKAVGAKLRICLIDYVMRGSSPNYTCKSEMSPTQNKENWNGTAGWALAPLKIILQNKCKKQKNNLLLWVCAEESFPRIWEFLHVDYVMQRLWWMLHVLWSDFLTTSFPWWNVEKSSETVSRRSPVIFDYIMQEAIAWDLTALTETLLEKKRKRSEKALNLEREL